MWNNCLHQNVGTYRTLLAFDATEENREEERKLLPHKEKKEGQKVSVPFSPVWSLIPRLWFKLNIKSPRGAEASCSPYPLFKQAPKIMESVWSQECLGAPISPPAFFFLPILPIPIFLTFFSFFLFPLKSLSSSYVPHCEKTLLYSLDGKTTFKQRLLTQWKSHNK